MFHGDRTLRENAEVEESVLLSDKDEYVPSAMPEVEPFINAESDLTGNYKGILVTYDWSGNQIIKEIIGLPKDFFTDLSIKFSVRTGLTVLTQLLLTVKMTELYGKVAATTQVLRLELKSKATVLKLRLNLWLRLVRIWSLS